MNQDTFLRLNAKQQFWYAQIMVNMVMADGSIHPSERHFLNLIFELFANKPELLDELRQQSVQAPVTAEPPPGINRKLATMILQDCVSVAISDGEFHETEKQLIEKIGDQLRCSHEEVSRMILWGETIRGHIFAFI